MPTFPPLLEGHRITGDAFAHALSGARDGRLGAGDCVWRDVADVLEIALVMEPEVARARCPEMALLAMVAFGDAAGALMPPEIGITYRWPHLIDVNGAEAGRIRFAMPEAGDAWLVAGLIVQVHPLLAPEIEPGRDLDRTSLWDEGAGDVSVDALVESVARHWVSWLHTWDEEGFAPVAEQWLARRDDQNRLAHRDGRFVGLDDVGNAIVALTDGAAPSSLDQSSADHISLNLGEALV